jgi:hypothetical protein
MSEIENLAIVAKIQTEYRISTNPDHYCAGGGLTGHEWHAVARGLTAACETFTQSDKAREVFKAMHQGAHDALMESFFAIWEAEGDAHRAGSMAAHAFIRNGARVAVFGAFCANHEPQEALWMACCKEAFDLAIVDVAAAFDAAPPVALSGSQSGSK